MTYTSLKSICLSIGATLLFPMMASADAIAPVAEIYDMPISESTELADFATSRYQRSWDGEDWGDFAFMAIIVITVGFSGTILSPFGMVFIVATIIRWRAKTPGWQIAAWITQFITLLTILAIYGLFWFMAAEELSWRSSDEAGVAVGLIVACSSILIIFTTITVFESKLVQQRHVLRS